MTQTDFAAGKNTDSSGETIHAKESLVSKKEKKKSIDLVLLEKCIDQREEETIVKNSHSFLVTHFSSTSTRKKGNLKVMLKKD